MKWEFEVLYGIQKLHNPWLDQVMVFFTRLAEHGELWIALGILLLCFPRTRRTGVSLLLSLALGYLTGNLFMKHLFARKRPCWIDRGTALLVQVPKDFSFPSGHTLVSFEGAVSIWHYNRKWGIWALAVAGIISCSRLYLFVHFPTDILGGMILGIVNAWTAKYIIKRMIKFKNHRHRM